MNRKNTKSLKKAKEILQNERTVNLISNKKLTIGGITYPKGATCVYFANNIDKSSLYDYVLADVNGKTYDALKIVSASSKKLQVNIDDELMTIDRIYGRLICCEG